MVQVFGDLGREFAAAFGAPRGTQPGELMKPSGVTWVGESLLLVLDAGNHRMHLFDTQVSQSGSSTCPDVSRR